jgi:hypothetical protein
MSNGSADSRVSTGIVLWVEIEIADFSAPIGAGQYRWITPVEFAQLGKIQHL